jgi:hypothetical protein
MEDSSFQRTFMFVWRRMDRNSNFQLRIWKCHSSAAFGPTSKTQRAQDLDMICWWPLAVFRLGCHTSFNFVWCQTDENSNIQSSKWKMPQLGTFWSYFQHIKTTQRRYDVPMMFGSVLARLTCFLHLRLTSHGPKFQHQMSRMENATTRHLLVHISSFQKLRAQLVCMWDGRGGDIHLYVRGNNIVGGFTSAAIRQQHRNESTSSYLDIWTQ